MRTFTSALALLSVLSLGCREAQNPVAPASPAASPDYAVYDAVLDGLFPNDGTSGAPPLFVLSDSTVLGTNVTESSTDTHLRRQLGPALTPLFDATRPGYTIRSSVRVPLEARAFHAHGQIELLSRLAADSLSGTGIPNPGRFWNAFYARYPRSNGYISFSRPGYDATGSHALLSYGHGCGGLCGDWGFILLERREGRWVILRRVVTAVS